MNYKTIGQLKSKNYPNSTRSSFGIISCAIINNINIIPKLDF